MNKMLIFYIAMIFVNLFFGQWYNLLAIPFMIYGISREADRSADRAVQRLRAGIDGS